MGTALITGGSRGIGAQTVRAFAKKGWRTAFFYHTSEAAAQALAAQTGAVVIATGETDIVTDGRSCFCVHNGCAMMRFVTGAGCQLSALTGAFLAASPDHPLEAALAAACAMGLLVGQKKRL